MNDDTINDLKQFIAATVSQQTSSLRQDLREDVKEDLRQVLKVDIKAIVREEIAKLEVKMDEGFAGVGDALEALAQTLEPKIDGHEARINNLESQAA